jgi:hypothetical protein
MKTFDSVWKEITSKAILLKDEKTPLFTLEDNTRNFITNVTPDIIWRMSDERWKDLGNPIKKNNVQKIWNSLVEKGSVTSEDSPAMSFTYALLARLVEGVVFQTKPLTLLLDKNFSSYEEYDLPSRKILKKLGTSGRWGIGGESEEHKRMKDLITQHPLEIIGEDLTLLEKGIEYGFITGDSLDIVMDDLQHRKVCIEVELIANRENQNGFHQALKYKVLVALAHNIPIDQVRTIVVAREIDENVAMEYKEKYDIEYRLFQEPAIDSIKDFSEEKITVLEAA